MRTRRREADGGSTMAAFLRPQNKDEAGGFPKGPKVSKKPPKIKKKRGDIPSTGSKVPKSVTESVSVKLRTALKESEVSISGGGKFKVVLIQEGLGNLRDCFYYTKQALQAGVATFEGIKCFADHPNQIEEQIHPERSTRDILGHYEDVEYVEEDGRGQLEATLILCEGEHFDWAKSLLTNALEYSKKYSNAEFVGFSINAQGEAGSEDIDEFLQSGDVPDSVLPKLQKAKSDGITEIRPVNALRDAISVDLVTEAGAGGKILSLMERNKKPMKTKKAKATKEAGKKVREDDAGGPGAAPGQQDHADAGQDVALFKKMISQYLGDDHGHDAEETMELAKASYEEALENGKEEHEAYEEAGKHLKMSAGVAKRMLAKKQKQAAEAEEAEEEAHEESEEHNEEAEEQHEEASEEHEESDDGNGAPPAASGGKKKGPPVKQESNKELVKLKAEVASLRESNRRMEIRNYLDKKCASAAKERSPEFIRAFKEALGKPRSVDHIEEIWSVFTKAADAAGGDGFDPDETETFTEHSSSRLRESSGGGTIVSFADCADRRD